MAAPNTKKMEELKQNVQQKFEKIREALCVREKLLLRQIDVIATSTQQMSRSAAAAATPSAGAEADSSQELKLLTDNEEQLLTAIRSYGKFNLDSINLALHDVYMRNEDYITPSNDHETMYKCLQQAEQVESSSVALSDSNGEQPETIVVDFSKNKSLIENNVSNMNESIINITLAEAKELIRKAKTKRDALIPPLNLEELDDERESSIAEAVSSLGKMSAVNSKSSQTCGDAKKSKKNRFKPKITINNCNGTINLRNISNLTINCATDEAVSAEIPYQHGENGDDGEDEEDYAEQTSSQCSQNTTQQPHKSKVPSVNNTVTTSQSAQSSVSATVESSSTGNSTPTTTTNTGASSNFSSNASSRSQSKKHKCPKKASSTGKNLTSAAAATSSSYPYEMADADDDVRDEVDVNAVHCEFYNRLLNEIKNSLKEKTTRHVDNAHYLVSSSTAASGPAAVAADSTSDPNSNTHHTGSKSGEQLQQPAKRLVLKNFENLKIVLESNGDPSTDENFHPVQIEQWLAEIISETDLEPMQNTDILEHSRIHNETC